MKRLSVRSAVAIGFLVSGASMGAMALSCSSSTTTNGGTSSGGPGGGGGDSGGTGDGSAACSSNTLQVLFSPMYSAYDGTHEFQLPAILNGVTAGTQATWTASDPTMVKIDADPTTGGVMLTMQKAGTVTITAAVAGGSCGASTLTITEAAPGDYDVGSARYNNGVILRIPDGGGRPPPQDGGVPEGGGFDASALKQLECTNCHGPTANGPFNDVAHTPEQTGGFSDQELIDIFTKGQVPDGGYFDDQIVSYARWQRFHQWDMTPEEAKGLVIYLRGITPAPQNGTSNFGGRRDGGRPPRDAAGDAPTD
jgi:hypothetical protein